MMTAMTRAGTGAEAPRAASAAALVVLCGLSACTMVNPRFELGADGEDEGFADLADTDEDESAGESSSSGDAGTSTEDTAAVTGEIDTAADEFDESPDESDTDESETDSPCLPDQIDCGGGECIDVDDPVYCGQCEPCEGECLDQMCVEEHVIFVTSGAHPGSLIGGIEGADLLCQEQSIDGVQAGWLDPGGEYIAWLLAPDYHPADYFDEATLFVRPDGVPVGLGVLDLYDGDLDNPVSVTESGVEIVYDDPCNSGAFVWTGSTHDGQLSAAHCDEWSSSAAQGGVGSLRMTTGHWLQAGNCVPQPPSCFELFRLYCVEL